ncbi:MAG: alpha-amylase [Prevotella sp.]|nr:alpha-amylase [Prevotella sp.]
MVVYQIFTRLFGNKTRANIPGGTFGQNGAAKFNDIDGNVLRQIGKMGVTHVWYTGIIRQATQTDFSRYGIPRQHPDVVKGKAGSPYAIADYYDVSPELAEDVDNRMAEFEALVRRTHQAGMKVIIDFVPNHVARQYQSICKPQGVSDLGEDDNPDMGFSPQNNFYYCPGQEFIAPVSSESDSSLLTPRYIEYPAKATGNDCFTNAPSRNDWYETVKLNYGVDYMAGQSPINYPSTPITQHPSHNTWQKMLDILLYWAAKGIDGFRCDMVFMVPTAFWQWAIPQVKAQYPDIIFIGEIYDPALYRPFIAAGFDYLYDKVGMYDCLRDVTCCYRRAADITWQWQATDDIARHMLYFLENHDEQRLASDFFAHDGRRGLPALLVGALLQQNPFMLYAGQELGERGMDAEGFSGRDGRTTIFDYWHLESIDHGYFNRRRLTAEEKSLMLEYQKILLIKERERAVSQGQMFDLMYVNQHIGDRQYAFLRKAGRELLLVVANFSGDAVDVDVNIPRHAFEHMGITEGQQTAKDLLTGEQTPFVLKADGALHITLAPWYGRVYTFIIK